MWYGIVSSIGVVLLMYNGHLTPIDVVLLTHPCDGHLLKARLSENCVSLLNSNILECVGRLGSEKEETGVRSDRRYP